MIIYVQLCMPYLYKYDAQTHESDDGSGRRHAIYEWIVFAPQSANETELRISFSIAAEYERFNSQRKWIKILSVKPSVGWHRHHFEVAKLVHRPILILCDHRGAAICIQVSDGEPWRAISLERSLGSPKCGFKRPGSRKCVAPVD